MPTTPTPNPLAPLDDFAWHALLAHAENEPDRDFAEHVLRPALTTAGLRVLSAGGAPPDGFRTGVPVVEEIERGVVECRYTVAVLSRAYVESALARLTDVMAQHLGVEEARYRLILVLREPVDLPLGLRLTRPVDLTGLTGVGFTGTAGAAGANPVRHAGEIARLIHALRQPPPVRASAHRRAAAIAGAMPAAGAASVPVQAAASTPAPSPTATATPAPTPAPSGPRPARSREALRDILTGLLPAELELLIESLGVPAHLLSNLQAPQALRAVEILRYLGDAGLPRLDAALAARGR